MSSTSEVLSGGELDVIFVTEFALEYSVKILDTIDLGDSDVP